MKPGITIFCISLMIIGDILTAVSFNLNFSFYNFGVLIKTPIELLFLVLIARYEKFRLMYAVLIFLFIFWFIGFTTTFIKYGGIRDATYGLDFDIDENPQNPYWISFNIFNRYILFFALMPMLLLHAGDQVFIKWCKKVFEIFLYANSIAIILGFVFKIQFFSSYNSQGIELPYEARFGYKGLLYGINETTGIYFLGIAYAYREIFLKGTKKYLLLSLLLLTAFFTGAKGCIISVFLLTGYYLYNYKRLFFFALCIPLLIAGAIYFIRSNIIDQMSSMLNIYLTLEDATPLDAFLTFFMTGRNLYISHNWAYMKSHWNIVNYIFGDGVLYSETDLFDLYYFFGIGAILYLYCYIKLVFYKNVDKDLKYVFLFLMLIALTGGHIIRSGVFPVFFCLYLITGYFIQEKEEVVTGRLNLVSA